LSTVPWLLNTNDKRSSLGLQCRAIRFPAGCDRGGSHVVPADWLASVKSGRMIIARILAVFVRGNTTSD